MVTFIDRRVILSHDVRKTDFVTLSEPVWAVQLGNRIFVNRTDVTDRVIRVIGS